MDETKKYLFKIDRQKIMAESRFKTFFSQGRIFSLKIRNKSGLGQSGGSSLYNRPHTKEGRFVATYSKKHYWCSNHARTAINLPGKENKSLSGGYFITHWNL